MLKLLLGRAGTGKTHALLETIAAQCDRPQVLIVPEQHSHNMERQLCAMGGNQVSLHAEVLSFTRLASRVFSVHGGLAAPALDGGGRLLLLCAALKSVAPELKVYQRPSRKPAFLSGLLATVEELKTCCITPEHLWTAGVDAEGPEGDKLTDLSLIYGAYEALTARQGADPRDRLTRLAEVLAREDWAAGKDFYLDGFTDFTPQERQVIGALLAKAGSVTVALTCDHLEEDEGGAGIFSPARRTARQLLRLAKERGISQEIAVRTGQAGPKAPALAHLERELFAPSPAPWTGEGDALTLFTANSPYSEVEWTAAEILRLVREEGCRFRDIAVCARGMEGYGSLIETVFARYGIPVFLSRMSDILQKPILALITSALEAAAGGYRYDDVFRYLKTGLTALSAEDVDLLENYVLKWNLEGSAWTAKRDWANHPKGYGRTFTEEDTALLSRLNALRKQVAAPLEALRKNPDRTGRGQAVALYSFLEAAGVPERLAERTAELNRRGQAALAEEYAQLWDILCGGLEQCAQILGDAPMELDEFSRLFALVLSQYDVGSIPVSLDRVSAGEMPRLAHRSCPVVFLLGADDGAIPAAAPSPGLLNDDDRSLLASYGLELAPRLSDKLYREMTIVYEACALPQKRFCVSWAAAGADGEEKRPSFLLSKLKVLFPHAKRVEEGLLDGSFRLICQGDVVVTVGVALEHVVQALLFVDVHHGHEGLHVGLREVGQADVTDLAGFFDLVEHLRRFFDGRLGIRPVQLIDVDVVGLQPLKALVDLAQDVLAGQVVDRLMLLVPDEAALGGDDDLFAQAALQGLAQHALRVMPAVYRRHVEQVDAAVDRRVDDGDGVVVVGSIPVAAKVPAADADGGDLFVDALYFLVDHGNLL